MTKPTGLPRKPSTRIYTSPALNKIEAIGLETICDRIASGESYAAIAESIGVSHGGLHNWLSLPAHIESSVRARTVSAEAWLDKGMKVLESSLSKSGDIDPAAARAIAQECARRAAIRNPQYNERNSTQTVVGDASKPITLIKRVILQSPEPVGHIIEHAKQAKLDS